MDRRRQTPPSTRPWDTLSQPPFPASSRSWSGCDQGVPRRKSATSDTAISERLVDAVIGRLADNKPVRRNLPESGRVAIDRQLPFLVVYRQPVRVADEGTSRFATSEASYLVAPGQKKHQPGVTRLVRSVAETMVGEFGSFLVLEIWSGPPVIPDVALSTADLRPRFRLIAQRGASRGSVTEAFAGALGRVRFDRLKAEVATSTSIRCCPRGMSPVIRPEVASEIGCQVYGLEISPVFRDPGTGEIFPRVLRLLRSERDRGAAAGVVRLRAQPDHSPPAPLPHARAAHRRQGGVGRRPASWRRSPSRSISCSRSRRSTASRHGANSNGRGSSGRPTLHYRPLPAEPVVLKRKLYRAPVERIEDPALAMIFREKLDEIDRQITMLQDRNTDRFLPRQHPALRRGGGRACSNWRSRYWSDSPAQPGALRMEARSTPRSLPAGARRRSRGSGSSLPEIERHGRGTARTSPG